jgi:hypothetical protein
MIKRGLKVMMVSMVMMILGHRSYAQFTSEFFEKHVAIVAATERSVSEREYVRQIRIKIFEGSQTGPIVIGNDGYALADDGNGHDQVKGDGIYTSESSFPYTEANPYNPEAPVKSVLEAALVNADFGHKDELQEFLIENPPIENSPGLEISIECDVTWCSCNSKCGGCFIKWGARAGCVGCPKFNNCKMKLTWSIF